MTDLHEVYESEMGPRPYQGGYNRYGIQNFIDESVKVGLGVKVWHYAIVLADCNLGVGCMIGSRTEVGRGSVIGAHARVGSGVFLPSNSQIGERVFIGPNVTFTDDRHPYVRDPGVENDYDARPPVVEDYASIGAGAVILPGIRVGHHATVAAGAIVTRDVAPYAHVRGEPARVRAMSESAERGFGQVA